VAFGKALVAMDRPCREDGRIEAKPRRHRAGPRTAVVVAALAVPVLASAQGTDTLRLAQVIATAREANPMLAAVRLRADAAAERVPQAGAWADPMLSVGLMNRPIAGFDSDQPMTMNTVQLTQRFPWPGTLGFAGERARNLAEADRFEVDEAERSLVARIEGLYYRLAFMDRAIGVMDRTRGLLRDFFQVSRARYSVGQGLQQDVLQAQVAIARMTEDITVMEQDRVAMAARLNALLGRPATVPIGALELPLPGDSLPAVDALMQTAKARRPALLAAAARVRAAEAGYRAARRRLYPDVSVTLAYAARPQFDNFVTLMAGVSIPLWAGARQLPMRREMQAMHAMEEARALDLYNETFARLAELRAQAERARNLSALYATAVLPQARAAVEAALSAYRVGRLEYTTLVQNEMTVNRYEIEVVRLAAEFRQARAQIEALLGAAPGGA